MFWETLGGYKKFQGSTDFSTFWDSDISGKYNLDILHPYFIIKYKLKTTISVMTYIYTHCTVGIYYEIL